MAKKKKVNPYRIPATQGDIEKAKRDATNTAVASTWAIMFSVLRDKEGYDYNRLRRIWDETNYLADSIARKYVKIDDLIEELRERGGSGTRRLKNGSDEGLIWKNQSLRWKKHE